MAKSHQNMTRVLGWLKGKSLSSAKEFILQYCSRTKRDKAADLLRFALESYDEEVKKKSDLMDVLLANEGSVGAAASGATNSMTDLNLNDESSSSVAEKLALPDWVMSLHYKVELENVIDVVQLKVIFLKPQIGDPGQSSTYAASWKLQKYFSWILLSNEKTKWPVTLTVYDQFHHRYGKRELKLSKDDNENLILPELTQIPSLSQEERASCLVKILGITADRYQLFQKNIDSNFLEGCYLRRDEFLMILYLVDHFMDNSPIVSPHFIYALVSSIIIYTFVNISREICILEPQERQRVKDAQDKLYKPRKSEPFEPKVVHFYSAFQGIIYFYTCLNSLLKTPLPHVRSHVYLNGTLIYHLFMDLYKHTQSELMAYAVNNWFLNNKKCVHTLHTIIKVLDIEGKHKLKVKYNILQSSQGRPSSGSRRASPQHQVKKKICAVPNKFSHLPTDV